MLCTHPLPAASPTHNLHLLSEQPAHPLEYAVLLGVVRVVLGGDLEQRGESGRVRLDAVPYPLSNLRPSLALRCIGVRVFGSRTCWLISRMAMSLRSEVKRSKAASMALFSVLASTTRKFFCASGGCVTCWALSVTQVQIPARGPVVYHGGGGLTPTPASSMPVTVSYRSSAWQVTVCG